jgi:hypothetical protein
MNATVSLAGVVLLAVGAATVAQAAERPLTGAVIDAMLKGNTVLGKNDYGPWQQYFNANGETVYKSADNAATIGEWNVKGDKFCSIWPPSEHWVCYAVTGDLEAKPKTITWISGGGGPKFPGTVQDGKAP